MSVLFPCVDIVGHGAIASVIAARLDAARESLGIEHLARHVRSTPTNTVALLGEKPKALETSINRWSVSQRPTLLIVPVKSYHVLDALKQYTASLPDGSSILLLHNGMVSADALEQYAQRFEILLGTTSIAAYKPSPTHCEQTGLGRTVIGSRQPMSKERSAQISSWINDILGDTQWAQNIEQALWEKLVVNAVINPLTAIHNVNNGQLLDEPLLGQIYPIVLEITNVMLAEGLDAEPKALLQRVTAVARATRNNYSSMQQDVQHQRQTEIDAINGYIIKTGMKHHISCPLNQSLWEKVISLSRQN
ncbi:ketopantoate reductase family protein [Alteromonas facilis]|uniref:ketopantoate reductase family protein n=1 Tax=Alteromonas facilis TaxID=2048004 RepID=UPI000C28C075|nr:2-dehydropantoate 2-reductase [Alteromonas facilis]